MIKANELRIGNFVTIFDRLAIIDADWFTNIKPSREGPSMLEVTKPIPLTPEILTEWYGFEERDFSYSLGGFHISKDFDFWEWLSMDESSGLLVKNCPKTLHRLQNLYYEVVGKELEIKVFVS